jgi:predicted Fe-Mo cluster-binding NifX family protein
MKIAIPLAVGRLSMHFGHCDEFAILDVDDDGKAITNQSMRQPPPHEPGALPRWLHGLGVDVIIASGMGRRAQQFLAQNGITAVLGAPAGDPQQIVTDYLNGSLRTGENVCDH